MALGSGRCAAKAILSGREAPAHHAAWKRSVTRQMWIAGVLSTFVGHAPGLLVSAASRAPGLAAWAARRTRTG
jgi:hypothetical protein